MLASQNPPSAVPEQELVLVLTTAVITVQFYTFLPESIVVEKMMEVRNSPIRTRGGVHRLVDQVIYLLGRPSQHMPKMAHFLGVRK